MELSNVHFYMGNPRPAQLNQLQVACQSVKMYSVVKTELSYKIDETFF